VGYISVFFYDIFTTRSIISQIYKIISSRNNLSLISRLFSNMSDLFILSSKLDIDDNYIFNNDNIIGCINMDINQTNLSLINQVSKRILQ